MSSSVDSGASKTDDTPIRPATDHKQDGDAAVFLTEEALLRLEEGLRAAFPGPASSPPRQRPAAAQRLQEARSSQPRAQALGKAEKRAADWLVVTTPIEAMSENPALSPGADQPEVEEPISSSSWRRRKVALLLCALLLIVGTAALGVLLKARTGGSTAAVPVNRESSGRTASAPPDTDGPRQPITDAVKSSAATPSPPPLSGLRAMSNGSKRKGPPHRRHPRR